jgi:hypothetical protein
METNIFNGIICLHDFPVEMFEYNQRVMFLHNLRDPLGLEIKNFANYNKISLNYYISKEKKEANELKTDLLTNVFGGVNIEVKSSARPYSELTPDLCWTHRNSFGVGGHDLNRELRRHVGKWLFMEINRHEQE